MDALFLKDKIGPKVEVKMKSPFLFLWICGLSLFPFNAAFAEVFQGQVTAVDRSQGVVTVQSRSQDGATLEHRVFTLGARTVGVSPLATIDVGEEIQVNATNTNGVWQINSLFVNPAAAQTNGVVVIQPGQSVSANSVFVPAARGTAAGTLPPDTIVQPVSGNSANSALVGTVSAAPTGVNTFNSSITGTTVGPGGLTPVGANPAVSTRNGAEGVPARNGAEGTTQSL
jgi:hypothetical protein